MLIAYTTANGAFNRVSVNRRSDLTPEMVWLDLVSPTEQDRQWVKKTYGQELQFVEELGEIEGRGGAGAENDEMTKAQMSKE